MFHSSAAIELQQRYQLGQREFSRVQLREADLRGLNLSRADLSGADLSKANLREIDLSGANLAGAFLNEADLTLANLEGANLEGASLIKAYLIKANLVSANLARAYLTGAYLTKSSLIEADLSGSYLNGTQLTGAVLTGARLDRFTRFDSHLDPRKMGVRGEGEPAPTPDETRSLPSVEELLDSFNHLAGVGTRYLGATMTLRYWEANRPEREELQDLVLNRPPRFSWRESTATYPSAEQVRLAGEWIDGFIRSCSSIVPKFPAMIARERMVFPIVGVSPVPVSPLSKPLPPVAGASGGREERVPIS